MILRRVRGRCQASGAWLLMCIAVMVLGLAGCGGGQTAAPATPSPPATSSTTTDVRADCAAVGAAARDLTDQVGRLVAGQTSRDQVRAAAQQLSSTLDAARSAIKPENHADVDAARAALGKLGTALDAQPIDLAAVRAAAAETGVAVGRVLTVCASSGGSSVPSAPTSASR